MKLAIYHAKSGKFNYTFGICKDIVGRFYYKTGIYDIRIDDF